MLFSDTILKVLNKYFLASFYRWIKQPLNVPTILLNVENNLAHLKLGCVLFEIEHPLEHRAPLFSELTEAKHFSEPLRRVWHDPLVLNVN